MINLIIQIHRFVSLHRDRNIQLYSKSICYTIFIILWISNKLIQFIHYNISTFIYYKNSPFGNESAH